LRTRWLLADINSFDRIFKTEYQGWSSLLA